MNTNIINFGAVGDGKTLNTEYIQAAIDECASSGGGRVTVPAGNYLTGTLRLKSNVELHLEHNAIIKASSDLSHYNETDEYPQNQDCPEERWCGKHLIIAVEQTNVAITGTGTIEGCAESVYGGELHLPHNFWWRDGYLETEEDAPFRPGQLVCFIECQHVTCRNITLRRATCWTIFLHGCDYVHITGIKIFNGIQHANSDGIDIDACTFVTVSDCLLTTGDDCITLRCSATERLRTKRNECKNISISNCVLTTVCAAFRIGVGKGTIHHATISNISIREAAVGFLFTNAWMNNGGVTMRDINISDIVAEKVGYPIDMDTESESATIERITFNNYNAHCQGFVAMRASHNTISDIVLHNMTIYDLEPIICRPEFEERDRSDAIIKVNGITRLSFDNVRIHARDNYFDDRSNIITLENSTISKDDISLVHMNEEKKLI